MFKIISYTVLLFGFFLQLGCRQEFDDVSTEAQFSHLIGMQYESLVSLRVWGITLDRNYSPSVDVYHLIPVHKVNHEGPEVVVALTLPAGEKFKVIKVVKCKNCLFFSPINVVVEMQSEKIDPDTPVLVLHELFELRGGRIVLKPAFFKE